jgi:hypothetical protein
METKQTIHLDENNKLVVNTNQGVVEGKESYAIIQGEFIIKAEDVAKLLSMINEKNMFNYDTLYSCYRKWFVGDADELTHQIECEVKLREEAEKATMEKNLECTQLYREKTRLIKKINDFNETRRWYERKLDINK